ncbi:unnamed protein product [Porites lobata]|uniref:beta-N-acetylhexosaminidase n=1 Tax=Porites lobata TaxID=104759 RepID=A0ABN8QE77_9CNID|nr:unnamed protein product [Porites lobata]
MCFTCIFWTGVDSLVQSKLYPELQEHTTQFYTQEQIKDLVSYAGDRGIRVIPEVESA